MKINVKSLGCDSNIADTNKVISFLKNNNVEIVKEPENADAVIVMTCAFNKYKAKTNLDYIEQMKNLGKTVVIGGCMSNIDPSVREKVDFFFGPRNMEKLESFINSSSKISEEDSSFIRKHKKIIRISTGCEGKCSYCAIKLANGKTLSRPIEEIHNSIKKGLLDGITNFVFTAEDLGSWGTDMGMNVSDLVDSLEQIDEDFKVSLTTIHPKSFLNNPALFESLKSDKVEKSIYMPIQSGSNKVLERMSREYTKEDYLSIFKRLKKEIPKIRIQSDFLVGFPGEAEDDFNETLELIKDLDFSYIQVFAYTDMERTPANKIEPKIPRDIIEKRTAKAITEFLKKHPGVEKNIVNTNVDNIHSLIET